MCVCVSVCDTLNLIGAFLKFFDSGNLPKQGPLTSDYISEENDISSKQLLMANSPSRDLEVHRTLHSHDGRFIGLIMMLQSPKLIIAMVSA